MSLILRTAEELKTWRQGLRGSVGFVPTMGALHAGHEKLLQQAREENDHVILSVFVNPTQFNEANDFNNYPQTWDSDFAMAKKNSVDAVFYPLFEAMYPDRYRYKVSENEYSCILDGAHRPGHFDGVLSVVMKLFNLSQPTRAYFGEKDFQQLTLIKGMVESFFMNLEVRAVSTVREADGLAMSSRNRRLTNEERALAPQLFQIISQALSAEEASKKLTQLGFKVDYVSDVNGRRFAAAHLGSVRLIDNVQI